MAIMQNKPANPADAYKAMEKTIAKLAHKWARNRYEDFDDLFQVGCIGLMKAYRDFDETKGMAFSSYAYSRINADIWDDRKFAWSRYNSTAPKDVADYIGADAYEVDLDTKIDLEKKIDSQDETTQVIIRARLAGYNFREISEMLANEGVSMTLHQCRNKYIQTMGIE